MGGFTHEAREPPNPFKVRPVYGKTKIALELNEAILDHCFENQTHGSRAGA